MNEGMAAKLRRKMPAPIQEYDGDEGLTGFVKRVKKVLRELFSRSYSHRFVCKLEKHLTRNKKRYKLDPLFVSRNGPQIVWCLINLAKEEFNFIIKASQFRDKDRKPQFYAPDPDLFPTIGELVGSNQFYSPYVLPKALHWRPRQDEQQRNRLTAPKPAKADSDTASATSTEGRKRKRREKQKSKRQKKRQVDTADKEYAECHPAIRTVWSSDLARKIRQPKGKLAEILAEAHTNIADCLRDLKLPPSEDASTVDCEYRQLTGYCREGDACRKAHRSVKPPPAQAQKVASTLKRGLEAYAKKNGHA